MGVRRALLVANSIRPLVLVTLVVLQACGGDDASGVLTAADDGGAKKSNKHEPLDAGGDAGVIKPIRLHPQTDGSASNEDDAGSNPATCGQVNCGLHGDCVVGMDGKAGCVCDYGYIVDETAKDTGICVEDKSCVNARVLQCRWSEGGSGVALHFSLQYCSGNPYTSLDVKDLIVEEKGNEDFQELLASESFATIIPREFLMQVYLVIDISNSIQQSNVLGDVAAGVKTLFTALKKAGGNFRVSVFLFDGKPTLYEFIPDTSDLTDASAKLAGLKGQHGDDESSSNVYGAVLEGIRKLDRAHELRSLVNRLGVLTSGTLIVVSDGDDRASLRSFPDVQAGVMNTAESVITVGLGDLANYPKLTLIGRDGSFSAPAPNLIDAAFQQIAERIKDYRRSQYLVGYCSPKRKDSFDTRVGVRGLTFDRPSCTFSAERFAGGGGCNADFFDPVKACAGSQCGGLLACGECAAGSCCSGAMCVAPSAVTVAAPCGQEWMCAPGTTCSADKCTATEALDATCDGTHVCDTGEAFCASPPPANMGDPTPPAVCMAAKADGTACKEQLECRSQHCGLPPDQPFASSKVCLDQTEMYVGCADTGACEPGAYCDGTTCQPQKTTLCDSNAQCVTGNCATLGSGTKMCDNAPQCFFPLAL